MIRTAAALAFTLGITGIAQANDIADLCPATGAEATRADYQDAAIRAFLASPWSEGWPEASMTRTPGDLTLPANDTTDGITHSGTFATTAQGQVLHMTAFGNVSGNALINPYRITVLRTPQVQAILALTSCGDVFFETWTQPSNLPLFAWP